jgi:hypothetical protein
MSEVAGSVNAGHGIDRPEAAERREQMTDKRKILFIGGWGRSGSSVLANILGSSPHAVSVGELRYLWDRGMVEDKRCGCGQAFSQCSHWSRVLEDAGLCPSPELGSRLAARVGSNATLRQLGAMFTGGSERYRRRRQKETAILDQLYRSVGDITGAEVIVDASKTPPYAVNLLANDQFDLYFIHLIRDPRAVAYSWSRKRASKEKTDELLPRYSSLKSSLYWSGFNLLALLFRRWRRANYLLVRYEDFCNDPRATVAKIFAHCGVEHDGLHWYGQNEVSVRPQHSISGNPSRFDVGRVAIRPDTAWRTHMAAGPRRIVTLLCGALLPVFGYRADRKLPDSVSQAQGPAGRQAGR